MTLKQELEALINTYAYKIAQQIFNIKEKEIEELTKENKQLSNSVTHYKNKYNELKSTTKNDESYRELAIRLKNERKEIALSWMY
ncbi:MAG: hypothetical protein HFF36_09665 [Coprobacillus sp.]|nr:hypothetical protein [Coprobacillus sp.]